MLHLVTMDWWHVAVYGAVGFVTAILSGIAGAGGGFIMTPLAIFLGLTPAQAVASGKFTGLAVTVGSLSGLRQARGRVSKWRVLPVMVLALVIGLVSPLIIKQLDNNLYRVVLGILLLVMIPVVIYKKVGLKPGHPKLWQRFAGSGLLALALLLQGAFSGGLGTLVNVVLMGMLGMTALEANITKRWSQLILNTVIILGVLGSGLIYWPFVIVGSITTFVGGYIGGHMAIGRGDTFIMHVTVLLMGIAGVALLASAF